MLNITYKDRKTNTGSETDKSNRYNQQCEKNGHGQGISTALKTTDGPRVSPLGDHMTRKDDMRDQSSGGETTWTNTAATRFGRGLHEIT